MAGIHPVEIRITGLFVPVPFLARVVWNSERKAPKYTVAYGEAGWFLCVPFGAYMVTSEVLWAKD